MITWNTCLAFMILYGLWRGRMTALENMGIDVIPQKFEKQRTVQTVVFGCFAGFMTTSFVTIGAPFSNLWLLVPYILSMFVGSWYVNANKDRYITPAAQFMNNSESPSLDYKSTTLFDYPFFEEEERVPLQLEQNKSRTL